MMNTSEYNVLYSNMAHSAEDMCPILSFERQVRSHSPLRRVS